MSKHKLNDKFLSNQAGQSNPNGKRLQFNEAYPNKLPISNKFMMNFKRNNETRTPVAGVTCKFPVVTEGTVVVSADGKPVLFFVKGGLQLPFNYTIADKAHDPQVKDVDIHQLGLNAILNLIKAYPPPKPKAKDKRHTGSKHLLKGDAGLHHLAFWQEGGHGAKEETKLDLERGASIDAESYLLKGKAAGQAMGALFELLDYKNYERYRARYHELARAKRKDMNDVMDGWVMDAVFGDFEGGNLQCHQLGLEFDLGPRDVFMMRSCLLTHGVAPVTKGKRYSTVLFSHDSMMKTHSEMMDETEPF